MSENNDNYEKINTPETTTWVTEDKASKGLLNKVAGGLLVLGVAGIIGLLTFLTVRAARDDNTIADTGSSEGFVVSDDSEDDLEAEIDTDDAENGSSEGGDDSENLDTSSADSDTETEAEASDTDDAEDDDRRVVVGDAVELDSDELSEEDSDDDDAVDSSKDGDATITEDAQVAGDSDIVTDQKTIPNTGATGQALIWAAIISVLVYGAGVTKNMRNNR